MNRVADQSDRMTCVAGDEFDGDQRKSSNDGNSQRDGHAFGWNRHVRVSPEPVSMAMILAVAGMGMSGGALRVVVHQSDFNRDSLARTARIHEDTARS
jgi:hypothetical protein